MRTSNEMAIFAGRSGNEAAAIDSRAFASVETMRPLQSPAWVKIARENWFSGKIPTSSANMQKISRVMNWFMSWRRASAAQSGLAFTRAS